MLAHHRLADAGAVYRQICALQPDSAAHRLNLGKIQHRLGQLDDAVNSYQATIRLNPTHVEAHYNLANALRESGDHMAAIKAYQRLLQVEPLHFEGLNNLALLQISLGDSMAAIPYLRRALQQQPDSSVTLASLGDACIATGNYEEALQALQRAVNNAPDSARAWTSLASAQHHAGRLQDALASYETLARLRPDSPNATLGRARILEQLGKLQETHALLQPLLKSGHTDAIHTFFNISKRLGKRDEAVTALEATLERTGSDDQTTASAHFKLGRHYDESGDYDRAFQHYRQANDLTPRQFDMERLTRFVDDNIAVYNKDFIARMPTANNHAELPLFILGMPRSGTSLVEQIVASHPDAFGAGELPLLPNIVQRLSADFPGIVYPLFIPQLSAQQLNDTAGHLLQTLQALGGTARRVTDKLPHNFRNIGLIAQLFPTARIIHCTRHPLDTCLSCYFASFGTPAHGYTCNLETLGGYYLQYRRLMAHWHRIFPERILTVSYNQLILEQEKTTRQLIDFCGLDWDDRCLEFHNTERFVFTLSYDQVRQPLYTHSLDRWKHYQKNLQPLRRLLESSGVDCGQTH